MGGPPIVNAIRHGTAGDCDDFEGFSLYRAEATQDSYQGVEILLPTALQWRLVEERRALARTRSAPPRSAPARLPCRRGHRPAIPAV